jgi:hypothetical protein
MPILKNNRYDEFETPVARDAFRGVPHKRFPWLLQEVKLTIGAERLLWNVQVHCLNASPSGFGNKMLLELRVSAALSPESAKKIAFPETASPRIEALFGHTELGLQETLERTTEGHLDELDQFSNSMVKLMNNHLHAHWSGDKIRARLHSHLRQSSPGGFGTRAGTTF